jgi:carbamoyltransferase
VGGLPIIRTPEDAARLIVEHRVVGVWTGHAEMGPRALGHRSLLARPDSGDLRRRLSEEMKRREWYRPVAPMMLPEVARDALDRFVEGSSLGRFMLGAWTLRAAWTGPFAGCVHADGTVRAQIVDGREPELGHVHELLMELKRRHGVQGVINTSFNPRGVPIVHELEEAVRAANEMGVDALWLPAETEAS